MQSVVILWWYMQRRLPWLMLACFILTVLYLSPQPTRAMPPPGAIRGFLLSGGNQPSDVLKTVAIFHEPSDVGKVTMLRLSQDVQSVLPRVVERSPGQSIAFTVAVWVRPTPITNWQPTNGGRVTLFAELPHFNNLVGSQVINEPANRHVVVSLFKPDFTQADGPSPLAPGNIGVGLSNSTAVGDADAETPDFILTVLYTNLPSPIRDGDTVFTANGNIIFQDSSATSFGGDHDSFTLKKPVRQTISVEQGDIFIGAGISDRLLPNDKSVGQMLITRNGSINNINKCSWLPANQQPECTGARLTQIGAYIFDNTTTNAGIESREGAARDALRNAINKAAQENAQISTNSNLASVQTTVRDFLRGAQERWRYPKGQMLIFTQPVNGDITAGSNIAVVGKKVVVFAGGGNIDFNGTITTPEPAKVAFISLGNSIQTLIGPAASESATPHFDGAYVALDVTRDNLGKFTETGQINIRSKAGVDSQPLNINGLLAATNIDVHRQVVPNQKYLVNLKYDSTFAQGNLIGLSSLIRPLASGAK